MKKAGLLIGAMAVLFLCGTAHAERTVWYVHPDSTLNTIQAGLDSCADNDIVLVGSGTYIENIIWPNTQGIHLISELDPEVTIIDGGSTNSVIRITTGVDSTTIINGFTVRNGDAYMGGGIECYNNSSPTISDNIITQNTASYGGGIYCWFYSSPTIIDNVITGNSAFGGGGIGSYDNCSPTISDNVITGNMATEGGGIGLKLQCSYTVRHNIITNNTATYGGGIWSDLSSSGFIDSCTISNNTGDGVYCGASSDPEIHYCNITNNTGYGVWKDSSVTVNAEHNWWGDPSGPGGFGPGTGDSVNAYVDYDPWLTDSVEWVGIEEHEPSQSITTFLQISPNPFSKQTRISFGKVQGAKSIELKIYDAAGRLIKNLFRLTPDALRPTLSWDGRDDRNRALPSGVYFLKFEAGDYSATEKLLLIR